MKSLSYDTIFDGRFRPIKKKAVMRLGVEYFPEIEVVDLGGRRIRVSSRFLRPGKELA